MNELVGTSSSDANEWEEMRITANSPYPRREPSPSPSLEVYKRWQSKGRLLVCQGRERHCSTMQDGFANRTHKGRTKSELRDKLARIFGRLRNPDEGRGYLAAAVGNMLERIVIWDREKAEDVETDDQLLLSTIPTAMTINDVDARFIIETFRKAMQTLPETDLRFQIGEQSEEVLLALLHYTFLVSRPVLAWELDLDDIEWKDPYKVPDR